MRIPAEDRYQHAPADAAAAAWAGLAADPPDGPGELERRTEDLLARLSFHERVELLCGDGPMVAGSLAMARRYNGSPVVAGAVPRLGVPGVRFTDGPRGVVMYRSTAFPSSMARGATFDPALEERIGDVIGVEARSQGANLFAGVCINLLRHPAWGRAQETYGEDMWLLGELGAALTRGVQRHLMACVKHYACNSMENSRFWVDVRVDRADLRDLYLPHFRRVVDEGVASVMTAYNRVDGSYCGHHRHLVREVLKGEWGFDGFVMSDFQFGVHGARAAIRGGMDLEMPFRGWFRNLHRLVRRGRVDAGLVDEAARRLLRTQLRFAGRGEPERYSPEVVASAAHRALAREAAARSLVLLRNDRVREGSPVLPLDPSAVRTLAVVGPLADLPNLGDQGSSQVHPPEVVTVLEGVRELAGRLGVQVRHDDGSDPERAAALAAGCDAVVSVVGTTWRDEGEWILRAGGDRRTLRLPPDQEELVRSVGAANPRQAVVLMAGSAVVTDAVDGSGPALLMAWYPGMEGGRAVADVLFGERGPEGRLPLTWPSARTRLPAFRRFAWRIRYGPLFGYRMMEATGQEPGHWFGHGLAYTGFEWREPRVAAVVDAGDGARDVTVQVEVANVGDRPGTEVVQVYVPESLGTESRPLRTLRGTAVLRDLAPGAAATAEVTVRVPARAASVHVGPSADPARQRTVTVAGGGEGR